ncbi:hypothetical protein CRUP_002687 [Coryphaenoides rupestris]|nr:hypothetical protein CRUP_002687 [Coryphaenoides rupestris]
MDPLGARSWFVNYQTLPTWEHLQQQQQPGPELQEPEDHPDGPVGQQQSVPSPFPFRPDINRKIVLFNESLSDKNQSPTASSAMRGRSYRMRAAQTQRLPYRRGQGDQGFNLAAWFIIHTVGPKYKTKFLENHGEGVETVVFAISDVEEPIYRKLLPLYFPRSEEEERASLPFIPADIGNLEGEPIVPERQIRITEKPGYLEEECAEDSLDQDLAQVGQHAFSRMEADVDKERRLILQGHLSDVTIQKQHQRNYNRWLGRARAEDLVSGLKEKVHYLDSLQQLLTCMRPEQIDIPPFVLEYDARSPISDSILRHAGPELQNELHKLRGCRTGEAKVTKGFNLAAWFIIHTVGPKYKTKYRTAAESSLKLLPLYFPRSEEEERASLPFIPADIGNLEGEPIVPERQIRITEKPGLDQDLAQVGQHAFSRMEADVDKERRLILQGHLSDVTIQKQHQRNYNRWLGRARAEDLSDVAALKALYQTGVDLCGRTVVVVIGRNIPVGILDLEKEYVMVYFHTLTAEHNHLDTDFLKKLYDIVDAKFKKNLRAFYFQLLTCMRPEQIDIPPFVLEYDARVNGPYHLSRSSTL